MAEQTVLVELKVSSEEAVKNIDEAKDGLEQLKQQKAELDKTDADYYKKKAQYAEQEQQYKNIIKANTDAIKQNVREQKSNKDSLVAMRAELKKATTAFDNLSKAEREGAAGKELQQKIRVLTDEISRAEQATGRFQRNVGNYRNSMIEAFTSVGGAAGGAMANGIKSATGAMKVMAANPIIAVLSILVTIIKKVVDSLKQNEEAFNRVKVAMSAFRGVGVIVQKIIDGLANGIAWLAEKLGDLLSRITKAKDELKEEQALTKEEIALKKQQRQLELDLAKNENKISELRLKATQASKYSASERKKMIQEAARLEEDSYNKQVRIAEKELDIIRRRNAQTASGTKDIDAENAAETKLLNLRTEHNNKLAALTKKEEAYGNQIKTTKQEVDAFIKSAQEFASTTPEKLQQAMDSTLESVGAIAGENGQLQKASEEVINFYTAVEEYEAGRNETLEQQVAMAWEVYNDENSSYDARLEAYKTYVDGTKQLDEQVKTSKANAAKSAASSLGSLSDIMGQYASDNEAAAKAQKVLALGQIAVEQGLAISKGVSSAMAVPFPGNIAAIASTIAAVLATIAQATSTVKSAKFATGGYISGPGTGTSDSIPAMLSNGESVINAKSTAKYYDLLSAINQDGGGAAFGKSRGNRFATGGYIDTSALSGSFRTQQIEEMMAAISSIQPVVSVREITRAQNRVSIKEQISRS